MTPRGWLARSGRCIELGGLGVPLPPPACLRAGLCGAAMLMPAAARACPFCQVGGERIVMFALAVVGAFIAGAFLVLLWAARSGHFADPAATSRRVLELDRETGVRR